MTDFVKFHLKCHEKYPKYVYTFTNDPHLYVFLYLCRQLAGACRPTRLKRRTAGCGEAGSCLELGLLEDCPVFPD